jgi:hypothetical protein
MRNTALLFLLSACMGSIFLPRFASTVAHAQSSSVIQIQETNFPGVIAELIGCEQKRGVLTVKVRVRNSSSKPVRVYWADAKKSVYLMDAANQKKYFLLKDAEGEYIYSGDPGNVPADGSNTSWFKFPALPSEVEEITLVLPGCLPFEDVPIMNK